jgi:hypothetical protein
MEVNGQFHALPAALSLGKEPVVSTGQEAVWAPELKKNPFPCQKLNPGHLAHSLVTSHKFKELVCQECQLLRNFYFDRGYFLDFHIP